MSKTSPTQRSLKILRKRGYTVCVVEKWNRFAGVRQDAFGFGDLLACLPIDSDEANIVLVQTTTYANRAARRKKIQANDKAMKWKAAGGRILLHGWYKRDGKWTVLEEDL